MPLSGDHSSKEVHSHGTEEREAGRESSRKGFVSLSIERERLNHVPGAVDGQEIEERDRGREKKMKEAGAWLSSTHTHTHSHSHTHTQPNLLLICFEAKMTLVAARPCGGSRMCPLGPVPKERGTVGYLLGSLSALCPRMSGLHGP